MLRLHVCTGLFLVLFGIGLLPSSAVAGEFVLHPNIMRELNALLRTSDELHVSLVRNDEEFLEIAIRDLAVQIDKTWTTSALAKKHERYHLLKILDSAREHLELAQSAMGEERKENFRQVYRQLVNVVRIYKVSKSYNIYFCDKDKSSWVQKGVRPANPFMPISSRCGVRVPN